MFGDDLVSWEQYMKELNDGAETLEGEAEAAPTPRSSSQVSLVSESVSSVSDAVIFGPRFIQLFNLYEQSMGHKVDLKPHLFSLCCDHIIPFTKWARASPSQTTIIGDILLNHDYLRSEVRNGMTMILIYTFAAAKGEMTGVDMFRALQDPEQGLAIANKFSLRIYNDPYHYLAFLKQSLSGLIDASAIPDNDRQYHKGKRRRQFRLDNSNNQELVYYRGLIGRLKAMLESGPLVNVVYCVRAVAQCWEELPKKMREKKFEIGWNTLNSTQSTSSASSTGGGGAGGDGGTGGAAVVVSSSSSVSSSSQSTAAGFIIPRTANSVSSSDLSSIAVLSPIETGMVSQESETDGTSAANKQEQSPPKPIPVLRFDRVGLNTWKITTVIVMHVKQLITLVMEQHAHIVEPMPHSLMLLDESALRLHVSKELNGPTMPSLHGSSHETSNILLDCYLNLNSVNGSDKEELSSDRISASTGTTIKTQDLGSVLRDKEVLVDTWRSVAEMQDALRSWRHWTQRTDSRNPYPRPSSSQPNMHPASRFDSSLHSFIRYRRSLSTVGVGVIPLDQYRSFSTGSGMFAYEVLCVYIFNLRPSPSIGIYESRQNFFHEMDLSKDVEIHPTEEDTLYRFLSYLLGIDLRTLIPKTHDCSSILLKHTSNTTHSQSDDTTTTTCWETIGLLTSPSELMWRKFQDSDLKVHDFLLELV